MHATFVKSLSGELLPIQIIKKLKKDISVLASLVPDTTKAQNKWCFYANNFCVC